jgi:cyclophilin family peptidyl-prolyl cis-trans isomerase
MKRYLIAAALTGIISSALLHRAEAQDSSEPVVTDTVVITTTMGDIEIELYGKDAPKTVKNFIGLINKGFYDGLAFHRVVPGFVVQAGDPQTRDTTLRNRWGTRGESIYPGNEFEDELNPSAPSYRRGYVEGTLAMANRGPNTNTSQFFIMLVDNSKLKHPLPKSYTIFGKVTKGMDIVHKIESGEVIGQGGLPKKPVMILRMKVVKPGSQTK